MNHLRSVNASSHEQFLDKFSFSSLHIKMFIDSAKAKRAKLIKMGVSKCVSILAPLLNWCHLHEHFKTPCEAAISRRSYKNVGIRKLGEKNETI